jgi:hypothetical protein
MKSNGGSITVDLFEKELAKKAVNNGVIKSELKEVRRLLI